MNRKDYMKGIDSGRVTTMEHLLTAIVPMKLKEMESVKQGGSSKQKTRKRKTKKNKRVL